MRRDVIEVLKRAEWMKEQVRRVEECLDMLGPDEALVVECLMESDDKIMAICEALEVSERTAYRMIDRVLGALFELFLENRVAVP